MDVKNTSSLSRSLIGAAVSLTILAGSAASTFADETATFDKAGTNGSLVVADAHTFRHCHNLSKRTYCHKADRLPQNWPPNTDTPHREESARDRRQECTPDSRACPPNQRYGKG